MNKSIPCAIFPSAALPSVPVLQLRTRKRQNCYSFPLHFALVLRLSADPTPSSSRIHAHSVDSSTMRLLSDKVNQISILCSWLTNCSSAAQCENSALNQGEGLFTCLLLYLSINLPAEHRAAIMLVESLQQQVSASEKELEEANDVIAPARLDVLHAKAQV